jgi:hypothetical protein
MKVGTIRKTRVFVMRYGATLSQLAPLESGPFPTDHSHAARPGTPEQPANISVTRRRSALPSPLPSCLTAVAVSRQRPPRRVAAKKEETVP